MGNISSGRELSSSMPITITSCRAIVRLIAHFGIYLLDNEDCWLGRGLVGENND